MSKTQFLHRGTQDGLVNTYLLVGLVFGNGRLVWRDAADQRMVHFPESDVLPMVVVYY